METNHQIYKTANAEASFICEAMLDFKADNGQIYNKICLVIIRHGQENRAEQTLRFYLDLAPAKVVCHDLWIGSLLGCCAHRRVNIR